jgi:hypothetical protein
MVQFETFWFSFDIIFKNTKVLFGYLRILEQTKSFRTGKKSHKLF